MDYSTPEQMLTSAYTSMPLTMALGQFYSKKSMVESNHLDFSARNSVAQNETIRPMIVSYSPFTGQFNISGAQ